MARLHWIFNANANIDIPSCQHLLRHVNTVLRAKHKLTSKCELKLRIMQEQNICKI